MLEGALPRAAWHRKVTSDSTQHHTLKCRSSPATCQLDRGAPPRLDYMSRLRGGPDSVPLLLLAPMENLADRPFRRAHVECLGGFDEACMEFIRIPSTCLRPAAAVRGVCAGYDAWELAAAGLPLAAQVMGSSPPLLALAAQHLALDKAAPRVDLNCGCPANTVTGHGAGSSLLRSPQLVHDCVRAMVEAAGQHCTVSVKMRSGFTDTSLFAENLLAAQEAGAAFITLHARTKVQKYEGRADWALIARARQLLHIPVVGNGDVVSVRAARELLQQTGCQGLMVGRGAVQDPLLFLRLRDSLRPGAAEQQAGQQRWDEPQLVQAFLRRYAAEACPPRLEVLAESGHHVRERGRLGSLKKVIKYLFSTNEALAERCGPLLRMQAGDGDTAETLLEIACETIARYWSTQGPTRYVMVNHMAKPAMSSAV
ncbi:dihydrouridine synthase-domain-containing protein [Haematococcus lacustris]